MKRLLVVHTGGIGDFLLCCPAIQCLARDFAIELAGRTERLALAVKGGIAEKAHDLESVGFDSLFSEPADRIRTFLSRFDAVVVWMRDDDGVLSRAIRSCGVQDVRVFAGLPPENWERHASEYYLSCLGCEASEPFRLAPEPAHRAFDVIIHPGSGGKTKNWPSERFEDLAERLQRRGRTVTWCVGPAEEPIAPPEGTERLSEASLTVLARCLASASAYVGNDSGVTHLAAACGTSTIAIFGPTNPRVWAPRGPNVRVVQGSPWPAVDAVLDSLIIP